MEDRVSEEHEALHADVSATNLKFCRHPYYPARYAALGRDRVRVESGNGDWGEFDRNGKWMSGPLRHADPIYCRWVTGEVIARECLAPDK